MMWLWVLAACIAESVIYAVTFVKFRRRKKRNHQNDSDCDSDECTGIVRFPDRQRNAPPAAPFYAVQQLTYTILEGSRPISESKYDSLYSSGGVTTT